jgi:hypothetical protein
MAAVVWLGTVDRGVIAVVIGRPPVWAEGLVDEIDGTDAPSCGRPANR